MTHLVLLLCCCVGSVCAFFSDLVKFENVTAHAGARVNLTCSVPSNESVSRIELGRGYTPGDGQLPLAVATSNNGTHITNGGYNYSLTLEWVNDSNTSVSLIIPNVTLAHAGYYTCNVTLRNCSVASGVHCNYSAGEEDDQYHANRTLTQRMHLTVIPATTIAPTTLVSHTTSTSHRPHRRPVSKRPTHKPVTLGPFPIDPWRPKSLPASGIRSKEARVEGGQRGPASQSRPEGGVGGGGRCERPSPRRHPGPRPRARRSNLLGR